MEGGTFHLTHRCQDRQFHLKFARDRSAYRAKMRHALQKFQVSILDYCLTSNHVHLLVDSDDKTQVSGFMRTVAGEFARAYNRRKRRTDAVWGDCFHATLIDSGMYLERCQQYIELNMVRCSVVAHPREWKWVGYHEIMGRRQRYRLLDLDRLCWRLGNVSLSEVRARLDRGLGEAIAGDQCRREGWWTESLAVGGSGFVEGIRPQILSRREMEIVEPETGIWTLREEAAPYGRLFNPERNPKASPRHQNLHNPSTPRHLHW